MAARDPLTRRTTHEVTNQPPPLVDVNLYETDPALREALHREGAGWAEAKLHALGTAVGRERTIELGAAANRHPPELRSFDRFGHRIDEVEFHPAYHEMMALGIEHEVHSIGWTAARPGAHVAHSALEFLLTQAEAGVCCPITMTYASVPTLRAEPKVAAEWEPRVLAARYDPRSVPAAEKAGATIGMAMTEKQGGSDVRSNATRARPLGAYPALVWCRRGTGMLGAAGQRGNDAHAKKSVKFRGLGVNQDTRGWPWKGVLRTENGSGIGQRRHQESAPRKCEYPKSPYRGIYQQYR